MAYWRYPIFSKVGEHRKEPDILIVDRELGLIIIEVKGLTIDQITEINGHRWEIKDFYDYPYDNPYQQAENQLWALFGYCNNEPSIRGKVIGRAIVALPRITETQWQEKGFDRLPSSPPIIFKDNLGKVGLLKKISQTSPAVSGVILDDEQWELLLAVVGGTPVLRKPPRAAISNTKTRSGIIAKMREELYNLDLQQEHIGKTIPPGPQRIRGIGGSGKTVLLCQKAVHMHLKHPDWDIALVFFTQSLYDQIIDQIDHWMRRFTNGELKYSPTNTKLRVLHAWGGKYRAGLYSTICDAHGIRPLTSNDSEWRDPIEKLADLCKRFLEENKIHPIFDAILIDEGQELVVDDKLKFENKQPIYWLAYQAIRPVDPSHPEQRRLIWAYDEAQNLSNLKTPSAKELFGESLSKLVSGQYPGGIKKSEVIYRCFRTPGQIITAAHAISMGLLRPDGMISGYTTQRDWNNIGYEVIKGNFLPGQRITLRRPPENSPNRVPEIWDGSILEFNVFKSRLEELKALAESIHYNLNQDYLNPSRDVLVIVLGSYNTNFKQLQVKLRRRTPQQSCGVFR
jgi:superfamily I DNA and RNA helicase